MKKLLFATIFALSTCNLISQDSLKKISVGIDFNVGNNALGRKNIYPSIVLSKGKHSLFLGPSFIYGIPYRLYAPTYGVQAGYMFYPNGHHKRFNLFFEYDFNYTKAKFEFNYYTSSQSRIKKRIIDLISIDSYVGFGFRANIFKGLYLKTNVGVGLIFYSENVTNEFYNGEIYKSNIQPSIHAGNFYPYNYATQYFAPYYNYDKQFIGLFKFGLGYDFYLKRKKKN